LKERDGRKTLQEEAGRQMENGRKEEGRKRGRTDGRKEGRKDGRKEGRKEERMIGSVVTSEGQLLAEPFLLHMRKGRNEGRKVGRRRKEDEDRKNETRDGGGR
jgi:hypothetical protein